MHWVLFSFAFSPGSHDTVKTTKGAKWYCTYHQQIHLSEKLFNSYKNVSVDMTSKPVVKLTRSGVSIWYQQVYQKSSKYGSYIYWRVIHAGGILHTLPVYHPLWTYLHTVQLALDLAPMPGVTKSSSGQGLHLSPGIELSLKKPWPQRVQVNSTDRSSSSPIGQKTENRDTIDSYRKT